MYYGLVLSYLSTFLLNHDVSISFLLQVNVLMYANCDLRPSTSIFPLPLFAIELLSCQRLEAQATAICGMQIFCSLFEKNAAMGKMCMVFFFKTELILTCSQIQISNALNIHFWHFHVSGIYVLTVVIFWETFIV